MNSKQRVFRIAYIYLVCLVLIRFVPIANPASRSWGFNHLIFLPEWYTYLFFAIGLIALTIPLFRFSENWGEVLANKFSEWFLDGKYRYLFRLLFVAIMTTLFAVFTAPTHFLGDGYTVIKNLVSDSGILVKWSEIGIIKLMWSIRELLGPPNEETSLLAFQVVSIISGSITIYFMFLISRIASEEKAGSLLVFVACFFSATLLLFFGYAEYYPVVWVFMSGFTYFGLRFLKSGRRLIASWLLLVIGMILHIQMVVFIPAILYLTFTNGKGRIFYERFRTLILFLVGIIFFSGLSVVIYKYSTDLYVEDIFLPIFSGKPAYPEYAILSIPHLLDIINEFILISPVLFLLFIISRKNAKNIFRNKMRVFLGLGAAGSLVFLFIIDPKLAFPRDWDLFSMSVFSLTLFFILLINDKHIKIFNKLIPALIVILPITILPFLITNLETDSSEKYIEYLIDIDPSKSISSIVILMDYYKNNNKLEKYDSITRVFKNRYLQHRLLYRALDAVVKGDMKTALQYKQAVRPDRFDGDYQRLLSLVSMSNGQYTQALRYINNAIQLRRYGSTYYYTRARIYLALAKYKMAIDDFHETLRLDSKFVDAFEGLAYANDLIGQYDSCNYYANKTLTMDSTSIQSYFWLTKSYAFMNKVDSAKIYQAKYARLAEGDTALVTNIAILERLLKNKIE